MARRLRLPDIFDIRDARIDCSVRALALRCIEGKFDQRDPLVQWLIFGQYTRCKTLSQVQGTVFDGKAAMDGCDIFLRVGG